MAYTKMDDGTLMRHKDGAVIPLDDENTDYKQFKAWESQGNKPDTPTKPQPQQQTLLKREIYPQLTEADWNKLDAWLKATSVRNRMEFYLFNDMPPAQLVEILGKPRADELGTKK